MNELKLAAPAKLNLTLDILHRREDGYHDLKMVMTSVDLCDYLTVRLRDDGKIHVRTPGTDLPVGEDNLAGRAARTFFKEIRQAPGVEITIEKHIPSQAGMAGGSSDAAAVLRALRELLRPDLTGRDLEAMGERVGSDVPYCVRGGTALAEGRGERLTDWPGVPPCRIVVCKPEFGLSTPELFGRVQTEKLRFRPDHAAMYAALLRGELSGVAAQLVNVFEEVLTPREAKTIRDIKMRLCRCGAENALMTGSGPTVFGLFQTPEDARRAFEELCPLYRTFLTRPIPGV
ncbi:4-diphosphocytidyl-2-C-methyl-D-erythritol kinase [Oscillibacter valericigenes Sjm18-20]|nr:4-diphosphocytidyl-2-C-methyl-D-erythritol kinase [Oscillibacter valericigenes Sjm18-20]